MPKIPEFRRTVFESQLQPSAIGAVQGQFQAGAQIADALGQIGQEVQKQRDIEQTANFNNFAEKTLGESSAQLRQDPDVQRNPFLMRGKINNVFQQVVNDKSFVSLSPGAKQAATQRVNNLKTKFDIKTAEFEVDQHQVNARQAIREGRQNYDLQALTTDDPIEEIAEKQASAIKGFVSSGAVSTDQGARLLDEDISSIYSNRTQKLLNEDRFDEARDFIEDKDNQEIIGAKKLQALFNEVERAEIKFEREQQVFQQRNQAVDTVQRALDLEFPLDPKDKDVKKAIDTYYEDSEIAPGLKEGKPEAAEQLAELAGKVDILPTQAVSTLRAQLRNGSPEQRAFAAESISKLQETSPRSIDSMDSKDVKTSAMAVSYMRSGIPASKAFKFVDEQLAPQNDLVVKERKKNLNQQKVDFEEEIEASFDDPFFKSFFTARPDVPSQAIAKDAMVADYKNLYNASFLETGDQQTAIKFANDTFNRQYGVTQITGKKTIMKYAPENYYGIQGVDNKWISKDVLEDIKENTGKEVDIDNVIVISDFNTAREASSRDPEPSYQVLIKTDEGTFEPLVDQDSNLLRYRPNRAKQIAKVRKKREKDFEEIVTSAKSRRKRRLQTAEIISPEQQEIESVARGATGIGL